MKKYSIFTPEIKKELGLLDTEYSIGMQVLTGGSFLRIKDTRILVTDIDQGTGKLMTKGILFLMHLDAFQKFAISETSLQNKVLFNKQVESFLKERELLS